MLKLLAFKWTVIEPYSQELNSKKRTQLVIYERLWLNLFPCDLKLKWFIREKNTFTF